MKLKLISGLLILSTVLMAPKLLHAQVSQRFENINTALNCGNTSCLYSDPEPADQRHFLSDNEGIPVMRDGSAQELGFVTEFIPSRTGASGADGLGDGDVFGIGGENQIIVELGAEAPEGSQAFLMGDTDGWVSMYFEYVDLNGTNSPMLQLEYILSETTWERSSGQNDRFFVLVEIDRCDSATEITVLDTDGGGSGGNVGGDIDALGIEGAWNTLSADLSAFIGCRARLVIEFDSNSAAESLGIDNIVFTEGFRANDELENDIEVPDLIGLSQEAAIAAILEAGFSIGEINSITSADIGEGLVIEQEPAAGILTVPGSSVSLMISLGNQDNTPPEIYCPDDFVLGVDPSNCGTRVNFEITATDDSGISEISSTIPSGSFFSLGTTKVVATATDESGNSSNCSFNVIIDDTSDNQLEIKGFVLIDADLDTGILQLRDGMRILTDSLGTQNLNIRAIASESTQSVNFGLSGAREWQHVENVSPFSLFGDYKGDYTVNELLPGHYTLTAIPYPSKNLDGDPGRSLTVNFEIYRTSEEADPKQPLSEDLVPVIVGEGDVLSNTIERIVLVDAINNQDIMSIEDGWIIDLLKISKTKFNFRADASKDVRSVAFELTGPFHVRRTENEIPFSLFGDSKGDYYSRNLPLGNYRLAVRPFSEKDLNGLAGEPIIIRFTIIENGGGYFLKLFPNPAVTEIKVSMHEIRKTTETFEILVFDMQGKLVHSEKSNGLAEEDAFKIAVTTLPAGVYYMTVQGNQGTVEKKTFVIKK